MTVIIAAEGYPGMPKKGGSIDGIDDAEQVEGATVFHAGTTMDGDQLVSSGGRVLAVTARGSTFGQARDRAYEAVSCICFDDGFHRSDIGWRELERIA